MNSLLPERLKECRKAENLTQQQLSELIYEQCELNVSRTSIARYETGAREPDLETLSALAIVFNVDVDYLLGKRNIKYQDSVRFQISEFMIFLDKIISADDKNINDLLDDMLGTIYSLIYNGLTNNQLAQTFKLITLIDNVLLAHHSHSLNNHINLFVEEFQQILQDLNKKHSKEGEENA